MAILINVFTIFRYLGQLLGRIVCFGDRLANRVVFFFVLVNGSLLQLSTNLTELKLKRCSVLDTVFYKRHLVRGFAAEVQFEITTG